MCGISGYLDLENGVDRDILQKMNDVIRHRGPDDEGYALIGMDDTIFCGGPDSMPELGLAPLKSAKTKGQPFLGLGHRRLSILDLSVAGHQPMTLTQNNLTVVYNGEIYNYLELRQELETLGCSFQTSCDTEVLLRAYAVWGEDCLSHFNGMWSFALWDGNERKLFCARDRLGAKPFHYWHQGNRLLFGSELKQLCLDDSIPRRFDHSYLAANLMYRNSDYNEQTLIEGMCQLRPGHKLVVRLNRYLNCIESFDVSAYWKLNVDLNSDLSEAEWQQRVSEEFARSCRWRLRSDAPLAALLSGGLDSSCLVAEICSQMANPSELHTFTTSYPGHSDCDEWNFADMVNRHCGCQGYQIVPDPSDNITGRFERLVWDIEGIGRLGLLGPQILLDEIHRQGFKVVLNGQCGDETMFGYERYYSYYFLDLLKQGKIARVLWEYRQASRHSALSLGQLFAMFFYFNFPLIMDTRVQKRAEHFVRPEVLAWRNRDEMRKLLYPSSLQQLLKTELTATQLTHIVRFDDRLYMSASIESRIPFMDYRFVELAAQIPPALKIQNGYTKNIMREIFDSRLPKTVTWRTNKMGFGAPTEQWAALFPQEYLLSHVEQAKTASIFKTEALAEQIRNGSRKREIFEFLFLEEFARQFKVEGV